MNKNTLISIIASSIIIASAIIYGVYYYVNSVADCTSNPLVYGAKQYELYNDAEFVGTGRFLHPNSPIYTFNSTDLTIQQGIIP